MKSQSVSVTAILQQRLDVQGFRDWSLSWCYFSEKCCFYATLRSENVLSLRAEWRRRCLTFLKFSSSSRIGQAVDLKVLITEKCHFLKCHQMSQKLLWSERNIYKFIACLRFNLNYYWSFVTWIYTAVNINPSFWNALKCHMILINVRKKVHL